MTMMTTLLVKCAGCKREAGEEISMGFRNNFSLHHVFSIANISQIFRPVDELSPS